MKEKRLLLIINPISGQKKAARRLTEVLQEFIAQGYDCTVYLTQAAGDGHRVAQERAADFSLVVCVGGDGTLNEVLGGLMESGADTPLGYIAAGSTNDFATSLGLPHDFVAAAKQIASGTPIALDAGKFNGRVFSYVASCGAFTKTSYSTPQATKNMLGHLAYILEGIKDIGSLKRIPMKVEWDGNTVEGDFIFAAISNTTSLGGVLTLDKERVSMTDGKLELLLIRYPKNLIELNRIVGALQNKRYDDESLTLLSAERLHIETKEPTAWTLDGEFGGECTAAEVEVCPAAVRWMLGE